LEPGTRKYELKRRAERQEQTRARIVEAAIALHSEVGPARTTISAIAARAGVGRPTVYSHFPDEELLLAACSGLHAERFPRPDPEGWGAIGDPAERLRVALSELYGYYRRHRSLLANIARDHDHPPMRNALAERLEELGRMGAVLARGRPRRQAVGAALSLALSFETWRTLDRAGLDDDQAVGLMESLVDSS